MKKMPKSLFQTAAEKYTSFSSDLKENKKVFFEQLKETTPMTAADLNKAYTGKDAGKTPPTPAFSNFGASNPGHEHPSNVVQPSPIATAPGQTPQGTAPGQPAAVAGAPAGPTPQQTALLTDPAAKKTVLPDGRVLIEDPKNPQIYVVQSADDAKKAGTSIRESVKATIYTVEDIMSALTTLSTGSVSEVSSVNNENDMSEEGTTKVGPAGDMLVDEEDETATADEGLTTTDETDGGPNVDQSGELGTSGSETGPKKVTGDTGSTWSGLGDSKSPEAGDAETEESEEVVPDDKTGVDPSYTQEDGQEATEKGKDFTKGAGQAKPQTQSANSTEPEIGEAEACGEGESEACGEAEMEANPSGKESAFWVPGDDLLGLKDIIGSVAKGNGVPDAQETIAKDANGMLVKKPTTPMHTPPNMRQYVRTNGVPTASSMGQQQQPADISDLDGVMGMDAQSDRALNISLNFNF